MEEHDGEQLAALCEQKGDVVNVREAGVAKWAGETLRYGDKRERREDAAGGDDGWNRGAGWC